MTRRPLPIQPASEREINASWMAIKDRMEAPRPQWRMAWIFASVIAFISVSAGATVLITQAVKRQAAVAEARREEEARVEAQRRSLQRQPALAPVVVEEPTIPEQEEEVAPAPPKPTAAPSKKTQRRIFIGAGDAPPKAEEQKPLVKPEGPPVDVFVLGSQARARGDFNAALGYYEKFVEEHPKDARAALAAMEACRILADNLENTKGALIWADRTIALAHRGPLREDAQARKVQLLGKTGQTARCVEAKSKFTSEYPESVHTERVNRACP